MAVLQSVGGCSRDAQEAQTCKNPRSCHAVASLPCSCTMGVRFQQLEDP